MPYELDLKEQARILQRISNSWPHDPVRSASIVAALHGIPKEEQVREIIRSLQRVEALAKGNARSEARRALKEV